MAHFDLYFKELARQLAPTPCQPAVAQATPLASADDISEAIEVLEVEVLEVEAGAHDSVGAQASLIRADQLRRVVKLLRASLHRVGG
jgi:hypothetical protein